MPSEGDHLQCIRQFGEQVVEYWNEIENPPHSYVTDNKRAANEKKIRDVTAMMTGYISVDRIIGEACFGSGLRNENNTMYDVGLVRISASRQDKVINLFRADLPRTPSAVHEGRTYFQFNRNAVKESAEPVEDEEVAYFGRTSGIVMGKIHCNHACNIRIKMPGFAQETREWAFTTKNKLIGAGDSGAWIFNRIGQVIGRLFACHQTAREGFFTPINRDIQRLEKEIGCKISFPLAPEEEELEAL